MTGYGDGYGDGDGGGNGYGDGYGCWVRTGLRLRR